MIRTIQTVVASETTDQLLAELRQVPGLLGLRVQRQGSVHPPGDVVSLDATNSSLHAIVRLLAGYRSGGDGELSILTTEPISAVSPSHSQWIARDSSESTWEEMQMRIGKDSNMTVNAMMVMFVAGVLAAVGISTNALHLVIAAMLIAPGFEPITRISLGLVAGGSAWRYGLADTAKGYVALLLGSALAAAALQAGNKPLGEEASYLPAEVLITYWTSITATSVLLAVLASAAGAVVIATNRAVLTSGVMVALALIPSATITAMAVVTGAFQLAGIAAVRFVIEAGLVAAMSALVFAWKRYRVQKRAALG